MTGTFGMIDAVPLWMILCGVALIILALASGLGWYLRDELKGLRDLAWLAWCWIYVIRWRLRSGLQTVFGQTAAGFLLAGSFYIFLELVLVTFHLLLGHEPQTAGEGDIARATVRLLPAIPALPTWADVILVVVAGLVFGHHWQECGNSGSEKSHFQISWPAC
jgi:hypothetical protein